MLDRFSPWKKDAGLPREDAKPDPVLLARRRAAMWVEFKRLHLGFGQALNSLTFGHSSTLALIKHAMLAEHELQKLRGATEAGGPDLILGEAMRQAAGRCEGVYRRINASAFDEKALSGLGQETDPNLIALMLNLTTAPFKVADTAVAGDVERQKLQDSDRVSRFTPEIANLHARLREHFAELARRAGLA